MVNLRSVFLAGAAAVGVSLFGATEAAAQGTQLFAVLLGGNEVSSTGDASAGDPDGSGAASVIIIPGAAQICWTIAVTRINNPILAHIHEGQAGTNGPVVIDLVPPATFSGGNPGTASGCTGPIGVGLLLRLRETPNEFYVNVHTNPFPGGAVRGQLF